MPVPPLRPLAALLLSAAILPLPALAEAPRVVADIAPVQSILAAVMEGSGAAPELIAPPGVSPHGFALSPSQAARLSEAEIAVTVGPALSPWFVKAAEALAPGAQLVRLSDWAAPEAGHGHEERHGDDGHDAMHAEHHGDDDHDAMHAEHHGDDDHDAMHAEHHGDDDHDAIHAEHHGEHDHDAMHAEHHGDDDHDAMHAEHHGDDDHDAMHAEHHGATHAEDEHGHDHSGADPHLWLDPHLVAGWPARFAEILAAADPAQADLYRANAARTETALHALEAELAEAFAPLRGRPWIALHDAYSRLETRFDFPKAGAASHSDAARPGPARIAELRALIEAAGGEDVCVFAEPQLSERAIAPLTRGTGAKIGRIDPLGAGLEPGPTLYPALMRGLARDFTACLKP